MVLSTLETVAAVITGKAWTDGDAIADLHPLHDAANGFDDSRNLVT
jgi:hypothetical protein